MRTIGVGVRYGSLPALTGVIRRLSTSPAAQACWPLLLVALLTGALWVGAVVLHVALIDRPGR